MDLDRATLLEAPQRVIANADFLGHLPDAKPVLFTMVFDEFRENHSVCTITTAMYDCNKKFVEVASGVWLD